MQCMLLTLFRPAEAVEQIRLAPRWVTSFLFLSILSGAVYALIHPFLMQATLAHLPSTTTDVDKQVVIQSLNFELPTKLAFFPVRLLIGWSVFSLVLFSVCTAFAPGEPFRFQHIFAIEVHAEASLVVGNIVVLILTLTDANGKLADIPLSLGGLIHEDRSLVINSLLHSLNIFTLWYVVVLTLAVSALCTLRKLKSLLIVLLVWTLSVMMNIGAMKVIKDELHLLL